jgi:DNA-binding NarL/FixJ family response regulator
MVHVALINLSTPGPNGVVAPMRIAAQEARIKIIILMASFANAQITNAISAGGFLFGGSRR